MIINHNNSHPWLLAVEDGGGLVLGERGYEPDSVGPEGGGGGQELQVVGVGGDQKQPTRWAMTSAGRNQILWVLIRRVVIDDDYYRVSQKKL